MPIPKSGRGSGLRPNNRGENTNPLGVNGSPLERLLKNLTKDELIEIGNVVIKGTIEDLRALAADPKATVIHTMVASVASRIIQRGDMQALDMLLNRLIGKVRDDVHVSSEGLTTGATINITLPDNGRSLRESPLEPKPLQATDTIDIKPIA